MRIGLSTLLLTMACGTAPTADSPRERPDAGPVDSDGDGITDADELLQGLDPNNPDTDGDGWNDGDELAGNTLPNNPDDHPYTGGWPIDECRWQVPFTGNDLGEIALPFTLPDQFGEDVRLHDFCGKVVVIVAVGHQGDMHPTDIPDTEAVYDEFKDQGLIVLTLLTPAAAPTTDELRTWADDHGVTHPVLADPDYATTRWFLGEDNIGLPSVQILAPGAVVESRGGYFVEDAIILPLLPD